MMFNPRSKLFVPTLVNMVFNFLMFLYIPLLSIYFKSVGLGEELIGIVFSLFSLFVIFFSPMIGNLSDHAGRKRVIYWGVASQLLAVILYLWPATVASIIIARVFSAIGWSMVFLISLARIEDKIVDGERGSKAGVFLSFAFFGRVLAPLAGTFLAEVFFLRFPFLISAIGYTLLLVWLSLWKSHHKPVVRKKDFNPLSALKLFWKERKLRTMAFVGVAMHTRLPVVTIFLPFLALSFGVGYQEVGILFFAREIMHVFQGYAGRYVDKKGGGSVTLVSVVLSSLFIILVGLTRSFWPLLVMLFLEGVANCFWNVSAWTFMSSIGENKKMEGVVVGSYTAIARIGFFVFSIVSGFLAVRIGISSLFIIVGVISLVAVLACAPVLLDKHDKQNSFLKKLNAN